MNLTPVIDFVKNKVMTVKGVAVIVCMVSLYFTYTLLTARVMPMSYGSNAVGANPMDLMGLALSGVTTVVSFLVSRFTGVTVKPEVIQAVINFERNPTDADAQRRAGAALLGYLVVVLQKNPTGANSFVLQLLTTLVGNINDVEVKNIINEAATKVATNQFKPVDPTVVPPV